MIDPFDPDSRQEIVEGYIFFDEEKFNVDDFLPKDVYYSIVDDYSEEYHSLFWQEGDETFADDERLNDLRLLVVEELVEEVEARAKKLGVVQ